MYCRGNHVRSTRYLHKIDAVKAVEKFSQYFWNIQTIGEIKQFKKQFCF